MTDFKSLTPKHFEQPDLNKIRQLYQELLDRPIGPTNFIDFLTDFEALNAAVDEAGTLAQVRYDSDTTNLDAGILRDLWAVDIEPQLGEVETKIIEKILATKIVPPGSEVAFAQWETARKLFRPENMDLEAQLASLESEYDSLIGSATVLVGGSNLTLDQADKLQLSVNRQEREEAWRAGQQTILGIRPELARIWSEMWQLRQQIAKNAGFTNFGEYFFANDPTRNYGQQECANFYQAIKSVGRPILKQAREARRLGLGLDKLRPWDLKVDMLNRPPVELGSDSKIIYELAKAALAQVTPQIAEILDGMKERQRLDLDNRLGKSPGAYQNVLAWSREPLIFMNAVGTVVDLQTLIHEAGHAFHSVLSMNARPFAWEMHTDAEMAEVASMSMELMAYEHLEDAGVNPSIARRMRAEQLEDILTFFGHCTTIDQVQHAAYHHYQGHDLSVTDALYLERVAQVDTGVDWTGVEKFRAQRWHVQDHVWTTPFYFIEYGLAQLAALNLGQQYRQDKAKTLDRYTEALRLGNTKTLPELFKAVGSPWEFEAGYIGPVLKEAAGRFEKLMAEQIARGEGSLPPKNGRLKR